MTHAVGLPKGWAETSLGDVVVPRVEQGPPSGKPVPYIDISSIDRANKSIGELINVDGASAPTRARQWVKAGDVLVSMTRPNLNAVAIIPENLDGAVASTGFDVLRAIGVLPEWIFNRVRSREFVTDVCKNLQGVVYPAIRPRDVRAHSLPIPPLAEQHRIVEAIESYLTRLDAACLLVSPGLARADRLRQSILKWAFEGKLVEQDPDDEPASGLLERIREQRRVEKGVPR